MEGKKLVIRFDFGQDFVVESVPGDGNCGFETIVRWIRRLKSHYSDNYAIRRKIGKFISSNQNEFQKYEATLKFNLTTGHDAISTQEWELNPINSYIRQMSENGCYATLAEMLVAGDLYNLHVHIVVDAQALHYHKRSFTITYSELPKKDRHNVCALRTGDGVAAHFEPIWPVRPSEKFPANVPVVTGSYIDRKF